MSRHPLQPIGWRLHEALSGRLRHFGPDVTDADRHVLRDAGPFTMTSVERMLALIDAARYVVSAGVPGAIAECGVWRGGSMMAVAYALRDLGSASRHLYLYDTFTGMPPADGIDRDWHGVAAKDYSETLTKRGEVWCGVGVEEVVSNMGRTGYPADRIHVVQGRVEDTIPVHAPDQIALLRLDTDWYESTRHELEHLYPRLALGGVLIIDDYGYWRGAKEAVDEYFRGRPVLLTRIDATARLVIKVSIDK